MDDKNVIALNWHNYMMGNLPKESNILQVIATRDAFFSGALGTYNLIGGFITDGDTESLDRLKVELGKFKEEEQSYQPPGIPV